MREGTGRFTLLVALWWLAWVEVARADPNQGEARALTRDADRVYTVVAGEGDGASTVTNPANLGFLEGVSGILDFAWSAPMARRRGNGIGAFVGIPLPWRIATVGLGYQYLVSVQVDDDDVDPPQNADEPLTKISLALAVPLHRWVQGLSLGLSYHRLVSYQNFHAQGVNQLDVAAGYHINRFVAVGLVARTINFPRTGPQNEYPQSVVVDPEVTLRPTGKSWLEVAAGLRYTPRVPAGALARFRTFLLEPRGRVMIGRGPVRMFAEVERYHHFLSDAESQNPVPKDAVRLTTGVQFDLRHVGLAAAGLGQAAGRGPFTIDGGAFRVRVSGERYRGFTPSPRHVTRVRLADFRGDRGLWRLVDLLDELAVRRSVVLLETRGLDFGWAQIEELREAILRLRRQGGRAFVYMDGGGLLSYFLASAADSILAHPTTELSILGLRVETFYFADLLAKLGARAEFVRIAEYKSRPEQFERTTGTSPSDVQRRLYTTDVWNHVVRTIGRERGKDPRTIGRWVDQGPYVPSVALREGIVDGLAYADQLDDALEAILDRRVRIEAPDERPLHRSDLGPPSRIAVVYIRGDLADGESLTIPVLGRHIAGSATLTRVIRELRKDEGVLAVVVRIDSPGGAVSAAVAVARELDLTAAQKPVVVSMGNTCASGGYYIATAGQYMYADATTLTGSIGVFYPKLDLSGTLKLFGVGLDAVDLGRRAGLRSWWKPYSSDERQAAEQSTRASYEVFVERVGSARTMTLDQVDAVARGRVWSGVRASEVGLVDAYGGLRDAVIRARRMAGVRPGEGEVVMYPEPPNVRDRLRRLFDLQLPRLRRRGSTGVASGVRDGATVTPILPSALVEALRHLPIGLWLASGPEPLAVAEPALLLVD